MGKVIPTAGFRRASRPDPATVAAFVDLDDAPGDTPAPSATVVPLAQTGLPEGALALERAPEIAPVAPPVTEPPESAAPMPLPAPRATAARWRRKTIQRSDGRELRKQTIYLDAQLSHRLAVVCAQHQFDISEAIEEAVDAWLRARPEP